MKIYAQRRCKKIQNEKANLICKSMVDLCVFVLKHNNFKGGSNALPTYFEDVSLVEFIHERMKKVCASLDKYNFTFRYEIVRLYDGFTIQASMFRKGA